MDPYIRVFQWDQITTYHVEGFDDLHQGNKTIVDQCYRNQSVRESDISFNFRSYLEGLDGDCDVNITKGDMNIDILNTVGDDIQDYLTLISEMGFSLCINLPTRVTKIPKTCIDHISLKNKIGVGDFLPVVSETSSTDHFPGEKHKLYNKLIHNQNKNCVEEATSTFIIPEENVKRKTWITPSLVRSINKKTKMYRCLLRNPEQEDLRSDIRDTEIL
ncbi:hypothetical protein HHI36_000543 [Cryptolaemus montrouzieri]|uniref:Uncharacterized protein n=1 Tax=Cryptolaemus montrouzieri TaxID=559131 RepID=A0ABD2P526_9CUCU